MQSLNHFIDSAPQEYREDLASFLSYLDNGNWFSENSFDGPKSARLVYQSEIEYTNPLISICIPTFKRPDLLAETVESVAQQMGFENFEVVIVNNSSDKLESERIVNHLETFPHVSVRYFVNEENLGMFGNWNQAVALSRGEWISVLNDDDLLTSNCIANLAQRISLKTGADLIISKFSYYYSDDKRSYFKRMTSSFLDQFKGGVKLVLPRDFFWGCPIPGLLGSAVKKDFFIRCGGFNARFGPAADYLFLYKASELGKIEKMYEKLSLYRIAENTTLNPKTLYTFYLSNLFLRERMKSKGFLKWEPRLFPDVSRMEFEASLRSKNIHLEGKRNSSIKRKLQMLIYRLTFKLKNTLA